MASFAVLLSLLADLALAPLMVFAPSVRAVQITTGSEVSAIPPVIWQLVGFTETNGTMVAIADPSRFTVQFLPEGMLLAQLDCNQGRAGYTATDGMLTLTPMAVTTAMCPQDSSDVNFQWLLGQATSYRFNPEIGHLVLRGEGGVLDLQPALTGVVWQWQETVSNTGEVTLRPDDPTHFTVEFFPDGTLAILADCNRAMGMYTASGSQLDLQVGGTTKMICAPASLADPFLGDLDSVVSHTIQQTLALAVSSGGVMQFTAVVSAPATPSAG
jgi:heat shock protein HslJ